MAKKGKKGSLTWWKVTCWDEFSIYIRLRDAVEHWKKGWVDTPDFVKCCTCGVVYPAFGVGCAQAGHFVPGRGHAVLFEEHCVHAQCYNCNYRLKGNTLLYRKFMIDKYGEEETERVELLFFNHTFKYSRSDLEALLAEIKGKIVKLRAEIS